MFRNYFLTAWRNLTRNKAYSVLNILGLSIGMAVALLIGLWVTYQYSFDRFFSDYRRVYAAHLRYTRNGERHQMSSSALPLSAALKKDIAGIEYAAHTDWMGAHGVVAGKNKVYLSGAMAEGDFFKIFPCTIIKGSLAYPQTNLYTIVLTQSTAKALFGEENPIGRNVRIDDTHDLVVTTVIRDLPANSTLSFGFVVPFEYKAQSDSGVAESVNNWNNNSFQTFVTLRPGVSYAQIEPGLKTILDRYIPDSKAFKEEVFLQPMKDWHLYSDFKDGYVDGGFIEYVRLFGLIGILVLLIACINFMNLSTARSEKRAREVGVRKAVGSQRSDLIAQFLIESLVITAIAAGFALVLTQLVLPSFNLLTSSNIVVPWDRPLFWAVMAAYVLITGLLAGSRPAFYLSSFQPVKVLKGSIMVGRAGTWPRKVLVVLQFSCSIALIISTFLIYQQVQYAKDRPSGYNSDRLVMSDGSADLDRSYPALHDELMKSGLVETMTRSSSFVTGMWNWSVIQEWPGRRPNESLLMGTVDIGEDYFKTMGMQMAAGRSFSEVYAADSSSVVLNEAAVKQMRLKDPVNQIIVWRLTPHRIIGVVRDALMGNPYNAAIPTVFGYNPAEAHNITYRLARNAGPTALAQLNAIFNRYNPAFPFQYHFVDASYAQKFGLEVLVGKLAALFAGLAIFISCLGLFGLAAYTAEQRTREIGIRKVLGASVSRLWLLLSRDFLVLVLVSCLVASPVAYYMLHQWLHKYSYRITIGPGVFLIAAAMALLITVVTVSFQAIRAALVNPTRSLRSE
jgi:putative ABC transport system permease protein